MPPASASGASAGAAAPAAPSNRTRYSQALLDGLEQLKEWPERVTSMQRNWIGRSEGLEIRFDVVDAQGKPVEPLTVFLSGQVYYRSVPRGRQIGSEPGFRWTKPSIVVINGSPTDYAASLVKQGAHSVTVKPVTWIGSPG